MIFFSAITPGGSVALDNWSGADKNIYVFNPVLKAGTVSLIRSQAVINSRLMERHSENLEMRCLTVWRGLVKTTLTFRSRSTNLMLVDQQVSKITRLTKF